MLVILIVYNYFVSYWDNSRGVINLNRLYKTYYKLVKVSLLKVQFKKLFLSFFVRFISDMQSLITRSKQQIRICSSKISKVQLKKSFEKQKKDNKTTSCFFQ